MTLDPLDKAIKVGLVLGMASSVIVISCACLVGEMIGMPHLSSWGGEQVMARSTAVALIILSSALFVLCSQPKR